MEVYILHRDNQQDHEYGRPAIFLSFYGDESLVWTGTTQKNVKAKDSPITLKSAGRETYYYDNGIQKVKTSAIIGKWRNSHTGKIIKVPKPIQKELISKFSNLTMEHDPYLIINDLSNEIQKLNIKVDELQKDNQELKQDIKELININKQLTNKVNCLTSELKQRKEDKQEFSR